jgi:PAS domain S-box-containing protein
LFDSSRPNTGDFCHGTIFAYKLSCKAKGKVLSVIERPSYEEMEQSFRTLEKKASDLRQRGPLPPESQQFFHAAYKALSLRTAILDSMSELVMVWDTGLKLSWANKAVWELLGLSPNQLKQWRCHELWYQRDIPCPECPVMKSADGLHSHESEATLLDGTMWSVRCNPFWSNRDHILGIVCVALNISGEKRSEQALQASEARFRALFEQAGIGAAVFEKSGCVTDSNPALMMMLGYSKEELCGRLFTDFVHPEEAASGLDHFKKLMAGRYDTYKLEGRYITKDGRIRWGLFTVSSIRDVEDQTAFAVAMLEDITERKLVEEELARLATVVEQAEENIILIDKEGFIRYVNGSFERTSGYTRAETFSQHISILRNGQNQEAYGKVIWDTISRGEVWTGHIANKKKEGALYEVEATISAIRDKKGATTCYAILQRDITNEMRLEKQLRQAQKMEAIGTLAGGIAHDFNNILSAIMGYTQLAATVIPQENPASQYLKQVLTAINRATDLVRHILTFSRQTERPQEPILIASILKEALKLLGPSLPSTIEIRQHIHTSLGQILADPSQIHQVLMNLCMNAAHAMREKGGVLSVELTMVDLDPESASQYRDIKPGPYVKLTVSDTGHGMDAATRDRIFDPFFTTKVVEGGTGMGLSVVHGIVKNHGGMITVYSEPDKGSTFNVFFPRIEDGIEEEITAPRLLPTGKERILFVDDEEMLVTVAKQFLAKLGYEVVATTSSVEALHIFHNQPDRFDLVITDQTMPHMTGKQLAKELLHLRPDLPIILCTGFSEMVTPDKTKASGIREYVLKPVTQRDMAESIRRVLN